VHLGNGVFVNSSDIIGVFDLDTSTISGITRDFLKKSELAGQVSTLNEELPKSFVLHDPNHVTLCPLNTSVLKTRYNQYL